MGKKDDSAISRYDVETELGRGAMEAVHRAHDPVTDRDVVIRTLLLPDEVTEDEQESFQATFLREAEAAERLSHPGIATVYSFDEGGGGEAPFLVEEYVEGPPLDRLISGEGALNPDWTLTTVDTLADALESIHHAGLEHLALEPAKVIVRESDGVAKIVDLGITHPESTHATDTYAAPERIRGEQGDLRSDLFSLAATLYEMLCGRRPFGDEDPASIHEAILNDEPTPVTEQAHDLALAFDDFFEQALAKDPEDRFQDVTAFRMALLSLRLEQQVMRQRRTTANLTPPEEAEEAEEAPASAVETPAVTAESVESSPAETASEDGETTEPLAADASTEGAQAEPSPSEEPPAEAEVTAGVPKSEAPVQEWETAIEPSAEEPMEFQATTPAHGIPVPAVEKSFPGVATPTDEPESPATSEAEDLGEPPLPPVGDRARWTLIGTAAAALLILASLAGWSLIGNESSSTGTDATLASTPVDPGSGADPASPGVVQSGWTLTMVDEDHPAEALSQPMEDLPEPIEETTFDEASPVEPEAPVAVEADPVPAATEPEPQRPAAVVPEEPTPPPAIERTPADNPLQTVAEEPVPAPVEPVAPVGPASLQLIVKSSLKSGRVTLTVDGEEVYSADIASESKRWQRIYKKATLRSDRDLETQIEMTPGAHEVKVYVYNAAKERWHEQSVDVDLEPGEMRTLRVVTGRMVGRRLTVTLE